MRRILVITAALVAGACIPQPAGAVPPPPPPPTPPPVTPWWDYGTTITVSGSDTVTSDQPLIVFDVAHGITAVWTADLGDGTIQVRSAHRNPGGSWGAPENVGNPAANSHLTAGSVGIAPNGDVTVVWQAQAGPDVLLYVATRSGGTGTWGIPYVFSTPGDNAGDPWVAADANSHWWVAWSQGHADTYPSINVATRAPDATEWTTTAAISQNSSSYPHLAVAPNGDVAVSWIAGVLHTRVLHSGSWSSIADFSFVCDAEWSNDLEFTSASTLELVTAECPPEDADTGRVYEYSRPAAGSWSAATTLSSARGYNPAIATGTNGEMLATWTMFDEGVSPTQMRARGRRANGTWMTEDLFNGVAAEDHAGAALAMPNGAFLYPYESGTGGSTQKPRISAWLGANGGWESTRGGADAFTDTTPLLAGDGIGNAVAIWRTSAGSVVTQLGDGVGPRLENLSVPANATTGVASPFHVEPVDDWTAVYGMIWIFGDGSTSHDADTTHTYTSSGTYTVTVAADDTGLTPGIATRTVTVTDAPPPTTTTTTDTTTDEPTTTEPTDTGIPTTETPFSEPTPTTPTVLPPTPQPPAKAEARLRGRTLTVTATVTLKRGARCRGTARATTTVSKQRVTLTLKTVGKACVASGSLTLKQAPKTSAKLRITITGRGVTTRTLIAARA